MKKSLILVGIIALALGGCGSKSRELAYKNVQITELERYVSELEAQNAAKDAELAQLRSGYQPQPVVTVNDGGQPLPSVDGGTVSNRDKDVVVSLSSDILFKPGSSILSDLSKKSLDSVVSVVKRDYPGAKVRVEGHTDNQPIRRSKDENKDNWDLSGNRAQAVRQYLEDQGLQASQLSFAGYGMEAPVASNSSKDGMNNNRRVEIVVITNR